MIISEEQFDEQFLPKKRNFETYGKDLDYILKQPHNKIWTVIDDDEGNIAIVSGYRLCNRISYIVTQNEWIEDTYVELDQFH